MAKNSGRKKKKKRYDLNQLYDYEGEVGPGKKLYKIIRGKGALRIGRRLATKKEIEKYKQMLEWERTGVERERKRKEQLAAKRERRQKASEAKRSYKSKLKAFRKSVLGITRSDPRKQLPNAVKKYFSRLDSKITKTTKWAKSMFHNDSDRKWFHARYIHDNGKPTYDSKDREYTEHRANGMVCILNGMPYKSGAASEFERHIQITMRQLLIQPEHFRIMVGHRAMKVFQNSFARQRFYDKGSSNWAKLAQSTVVKRNKRNAAIGIPGAGLEILREYGDLYRSIKVEDTTAEGFTRVFTDTVPANPDNHKKHDSCYAALHNEGYGHVGGKRGKAQRKFVKRQFMGHSSYLDPIMDPFMSKMMKNYLFDGVFLTMRYNKS